MWFDVAVVAIFRRFDFWVVTGFLLLGAIYVLVTQSVHDRLKAPAKVVQVVIDPVAPPSPKADPTVAAPSLPFSVEATSWQEQGGQHWLLEMRVRYRNEGDGAKSLVGPEAGVVTAAGEAVEPFFLAVAPVPEVPAHSEDTVELRYWIGEKQAREELWLQVDGKRTRVEAPPARL